MNRWISLLSLRFRTHPSKSLLLAYADGELQPADRRRVYRHLNCCRECRETVDSEQKLLEFIGSIEPAPAAIAVTRERLFEALERVGTETRLREMSQEVESLLGKNSTMSLSRSSGRITPGIEAQIVGFLGIRAASRFKRRWAISASA